jgi:hypothetical protein
MRVGPKVNGKDGIERRGSRQRSPALSAPVFGSAPAAARALRTGLLSLSPSGTKVLTIQS